jgi:hypothetical protein
MRVLVAALALAACGTKASPMDSGAPMDSGCAEAGTATYPSGPYGITQRSGSVPGDRIENFAFQGYLNLDPKTKTQKGALQPIKLGDFYDPMAKRFRIIYLTTSGVWCTACIQETQYLDAPGGPAETLAPQGVTIVQALMEGAANVPSTQTDLDYWITTFSVNFTEVLDPSSANLGVFSPASAVPFSVIIDARSMEILARDKGFASGPPLEAELKTWLAWTMNNPPLATGCP